MVELWNEKVDAQFERSFADELADGKLRLDSMWKTTDEVLLEEIMSPKHMFLCS